jgi:hypothetical protein
MCKIKQAMKAFLHGSAAVTAHLIRYFTLTLFLIVYNRQANAQFSTCNPIPGLPAGKPVSVLEHLTRTEGDTLYLSLDLDTLLNLRHTNTYLPATLRSAKGETWRTEVRSRGKYRRKFSDIPPLKLKFSKKELRARGLDTLNEIRLLLPFQLDFEGEQLLTREYTAYRIFEALNPVSFRARWVRIALHNNDDKGKKSRQKYTLALLIEHEEELAARMQATLHELWLPPDSTICETQAASVILFEYLIGNTDWALASSRNILFMKPPGHDKTLIVPYDFDFSGFVSAPYATPKGETGLKNVRDRKLMAGNINSATLQQALEHIRRSESALYRICRQRPASAALATEMCDYLSVFFAAVAGKKGLPVFISADGR